MSENAHFDVEPNRIGLRDFTNFMKFYDKDFNELQSTDVFMLLTKRLAMMLVGTKPAEDILANTFD